MILLKKIEKLSFYIGAIGIIFLPFSLSLAQSFLYLSSCILMVYLIYKRDHFFDQDSKNIFIAFLAFYIWNYISNVYNSEYSLESIKDFFLIFFGIWIYYFSQGEFKDKLLKYITLVFFIFLVAGIISSFLPFRLSNLMYHLQNGFFFNSKYRAQHLLFSFPFGSWNFSDSQFPFGIYIPVGFTGTHLSFGSLISIISLLFFLRFLKEISIKHGIIFLLFLTIVFFSHARSAIFGLLIAFFYILFTIILKGKTKIKFIITIAFIVIIFIFYLVLPENLQRFFPFYKKHSDYQRVFLWYLSLEVYFKHFLVGVGTLNFSNRIFQQILITVQEKPLLWYPLYQTEIMHAHNDFLYFLVGSGIIGAILFLNIFYQKLKILHQNLNFLVKQHYTIEDFFLVFLFSPVYLLFAGMFQCFFLDDYTMQLYWLVYGTGLGILQNIKKTQKE